MEFTGTGRAMSADNSTTTPGHEDAHFEAAIEPCTTSDINDPSRVRVKDKAWAIAFVANACFTLFVAIFCGSASTSAEVHGRRLSAGVTFGGLTWLLVVVAVMSLVTWGWTAGTLHLLTVYPKRMLQIGYLGFAGLWAVLAIVLLSWGLKLAAAFIAVICVICLLFFWKGRSRINFGAANLKVAALAVKETPGIVRYPMLTNIFLTLWSVTAAVAASGSVAAFTTVVGPSGTSYPASDCRDISRITAEGVDSWSCECDSVQVSAHSGCDYRNDMRGFLTFFWLLSTSWGFAVVHNVVNATVTGAVASWWFSPAEKNAVKGAFHRATRSSFGSLCKAAVVVAVLQLIKRLLRRVACLRVIFSVFAQHVIHGLSYVVCMISIYGLSFSEALGRTKELFRQNGVNALLNDYLVSLGLYLLALGMTVCYVAVMLLCYTEFIGFGFSSTGPAEGLGAVWVLLLVVPLLMGPGAVYFWTTLEVVRSSQKAIFVCFIQDPDALQANHDRHIYDGLSEAWKQVQAENPDMFNSSDLPEVQMTEFPGTRKPEFGGSKVSCASDVAAPGVQQV